MNRKLLLIPLLSVLLCFFSCSSSKNRFIHVQGKICATDDSSPLSYPLIKRLSDGKIFVGDDCGTYNLQAVIGDSLSFSYVGLLSDTLVVKDSILNVELKSYLPGLEFVDSVHPLKHELSEYLQNKDARIGVAIILHIDNMNDTIEINGHKEFPMMSVFKFPLALAAAYKVDSLNTSFDEHLDISEANLKENTYSPMLAKYGRTLNTLTLRELLEWSLIESDNNAADLILEFVEGIPGINRTMKHIGVGEGMSFGASEDDMHRDPFLCYLNRSTPIEMVKLIDRFNVRMRNSSDSFVEIGEMLERCATGSDRLSAPLEATGAIIGHKTGTGDSLMPGRICAVNDCGYVNLPDGNSYSVSVFVADSAYGMKETAKIIADMSKIIYTYCL